MVELVTGDEYEEMAAAFQCAQIQLLDQVLQRRGLEPGMRRAICEDFTHRFGVFLDQQWFESEVGRAFPVVAFSRRHPDHSPEQLHLNNRAFSFAEYAFGDIAWYFEEHAGEPEPQKIGAMSADGEPA